MLQTLLRGISEFQILPIGEIRVDCNTNVFLRLFLSLFFNLSLVPCTKSKRLSLSILAPEIEVVECVRCQQQDPADNA